VIAPHQISMLAPPVTKSDPATSDDRCTPPNVLACVSSFWPAGIDLDPCSNAWSLVQARRAWTKSDDALAKRWDDHICRGGTIWLNPPFSNPEPFIARLILAIHDVNGEALLLVRHDSTTAWWQAIEHHADALCLVRDRVRFRLAGEDTGAADHATTIAMFTRRTKPKDIRAKRLRAFVRAFDPIGLCVEVQR
jgi:phage N-6-adenine-methyltransferase